MANANSNCYGCYSDIQNSNMSSGGKQKPSISLPMILCKVLVVGNAKCGKTSLIRRFSKNSFDCNYETTVGVDFVRKDLEVLFETQRFNGSSECDNESALVRMQLWDIAGQDRFARLTRAYFRRAKAAAIVCDLTRKGTFEAVRQWKQEIDKWALAEQDGSTNHSKIPVVLFANKSDLLEGTTESFLAGAKMESVCRDLGIVAWFVTSAKDGDNVEQGFRHLATLVATKDHYHNSNTLKMSSLAEQERPTWDASCSKAGTCSNEEDDDATNSHDAEGAGDSLLRVWDLDDF